MLYQAELTGQKRWFVYGVPGQAQTGDLNLRRVALYSSELQGRDGLQYAKRIPKPLALESTLPGGGRSEVRTRHHPVKSQVPNELNALAILFPGGAKPCSTLHVCRPS